MMHPVMREFYKERNVVMEERRMRTDSRPTGRLVEQFLGTAFMANPYHRPTIGYASDLQSFLGHRCGRVLQALLRAQQHGDRPGGRPRSRRRCFPSSSEYFGQLPTAPKPLELYTIEPPQNSVREVTLHDPSQPFYLEGYHRPSYLAPDDAVYDAISDMLSNGRTSRLYRSLVRDQADRRLRRRLHRISRQQVRSPVRVLCGADSRPHHRRDAEGHSRRDREAEDAGRDRRRAADVQDAHQGRPDSRPGQQRRTGAAAWRTTRRAMATGASCSAISIAWTR